LSAEQFMPLLDLILYEGSGEKGDWSVALTLEATQIPAASCVDRNLRRCCLRARLEPLKDADVR
jgi:hypothetical protein